MAMAVSTVSAVLLILLIQPTINLASDDNFTDTLNRIEAMLDQLRSTDFTTTNCTETLEYISKYLSKWNLKDRSEYGQNLVAYGILDIFSLWLDHFKQQSTNDYSKLFMGKMLKVLLEGSRVDPYPGLTTDAEVLHKILSLTSNDNLFNDRGFATDARLIAFDLSWNLYFAESRYKIQPYVMKTLTSVYGAKFDGLKQNRLDTNEMLLLYEGKLWALQSSSETEAAERFSFDNNTLQSSLDKYLKRIEIPLTQPIRYRLMTNYSYEEWPLWYHDILLLFNNVLMSPRNRVFLCKSVTYHHYLTAIHIFKSARQFDQQRYIGRMCLRAIRGLTMLHETCEKASDYFTKADFEALQSLENHQYLNIAKETKVLLQTMASSNKLCDNRTISYKVDFGGVYPTCTEPKLDAIVQQIEFATISGISGAAIVAVMVAVFIRQIRAKCKRKLEKKYSTDQSDVRKLSNVAATEITSYKRTARTVKDLLSPEFYVDLSKERTIPVINYERLIHVTNLGKGNFATVDKKMLQNSYNGDYLFVADKCAKARFYEMLLKEKTIMARMPLHVNVIKLLAVTIDDEGMEHLILEYCDHDSLHDTIRISYIRDTSFSDAIDMDGDKIGLTRYHLYFIAYQIIDGMNFLSKNNLVHRDLALRNILLAIELLVKISDFGLTKEAVKEYCADSQNPLPPEIAPEVRRKRVFTTKSDVYSLGILLWLLFELSVSDSESLLTLASTGVPVRPPKYACDKIYALIQSCLKRNPKSRPDFEACLNQIISACNSQSVTLIGRIKENVLKYGNRCLQVENGIY